MQPTLELVACMPVGRPKPTPLLFVHGAWHAAWCWENFLPYFANHEYATYALSLRGHGGSSGRDRLRWASASKDYVNDLAAVVAMLPAPPVLIGHSLGGYIVQKYLERHEAPAAILLAPTPIYGTLGLAWRYTLRHPRACLRMLRTCDPWHLVGTAALAQSSFFSTDLALPAIARHVMRLQTESMLVLFETTLNPPRRRRITTPILVLGAANDRVFTQQEIQATAQAYRTRATLFPNMAHDMMLDRGWEAVGAQMVAWLERDKLAS